MDAQQTVLAAYDASEEAADGLALARLLASLTGSDLLVTRVVDNAVRFAERDPSSQRAIRAQVGATRAAMLAAIPFGVADAPIVPARDSDVARALHEVARANGASMLVLGSSHHSRVG